MCFQKNKQLSDVVKECEQIFEMMKSETACFTGHRSQKLPWKFNEQDERCIAMRAKAKELIEEAIKNGYVNFISGMALGFDMICAELVLELKEKYPHIKLICAIPCKTQSNPWHADQQKRYQKILKQADIKRYISNEYTDSCMHERNDYMLKNSSLVIALYNGTFGGTQSTLKKAEKMGLKVEIIKP